MIYKKSYILLMFIGFLVIPVNDTHAAWTGPEEIISGAWGNAVGQFDLHKGDSWDTFPMNFDIDGNGRVYISDLGNRRVYIYEPSGVVPNVVVLPSDLDQSSDWPEYVATHESGYFVTPHSGGLKLLFDPDGKLIKRLQMFGEANAVPEGYFFEYKDDEMPLYTVTGDYIKTLTEYPRHLTAGSKFDLGPGAVQRYDICGRQFAYLLLPESKIDSVGAFRGDIITLHYEYGRPFLAPNGDIYTWKRTPDKYSILKWTWEDDPNTPPAVPGPPRNPGVEYYNEGQVYMKWGSSLQEKACVTHYEVYRSDKTDGSYALVSTVPKGTYYYHDGAAEIGQTYYYKIRAKGGEGYSEYTAPVAGTRQAQ